MSKVTRADWANGVDWENIANKPAFPGGVSDIGQLTGLGFGNGQVPRWSMALRRFVAWTPSSTSPPTPTPTPVVQQLVSWDAPELLPLQSAYEDFEFPGVMVSQPIILGAPVLPPYIIAFASVPDFGYVRITITNLSLATIDVGEGTWTLRL